MSMQHSVVPCALTVLRVTVQEEEDEGEEGHESAMDTTAANLQAAPISPTARKSTPYDAATGVKFQPASKTGDGEHISTCCH